MTTFVGSQTTTQPYSAVVYLEVTYASGNVYTGSGVMVGANDVLTAGHMVYNDTDGLAVSVQVSAGYNNGTEPFGTLTAARINYFDYDTDGNDLLSRSESQDDLALISLPTALGNQTGWMTMTPGQTTGNYNLTGYPGYYAGAHGAQQTNDYGHVTEDPYNWVFNYNSIESHPGNSGGPLWYQGANGALVVGIASTGAWAADITLHYDQLVLWTVQNNDLIAPSAERQALDVAYENITRVNVSAAEAAYSDLIHLNTMANQNTAGTLTFAEAIGHIVDFADNTTSVATTTYQFFTDRLPTEAGLDFLVNAPDNVNSTDLNDPYYQSFNVQNRFINFSVNLGVLGEGSSEFAEEYGDLTLTQATAKAYEEIFGVAASASHIDRILNGQVPDPSNPGSTFARSEYFEYYGNTPLGTKAAVVGWLLAEGVNNDIGAYANANENFLTDLVDGNAQFNIDLIGVYTPENSGRIDFT